MRNSVRADNKNERWKSFRVDITAAISQLSFNSLISFKLTGTEEQANRSLTLFT